jgi:hypothetical protein
VFSLLVLLFILGALRWVDYLDQPHEPKVVAVPVRTRQSVPAKAPEPTFSNTGVLKESKEIEPPVVDPEGPRDGAGGVLR